MTFGGTDIHSVPPISDAGNGGSPDISDDGSHTYPENQSQLTVWTGSSNPTAQQCLYLIRTQGSGSNVPVTIGTTVCALTSENTLAIIHVTAVDPDDISYPMSTLTTIYAITTG